MDWKRLLLSFEGRIARGGFWLGVVLSLILAGAPPALAAVAGLALDRPPALAAVAAVELLALWMLFAVHAKRWHDRDKSGWWSLLMLAPPIGQIWILVELGMMRGTPGANAHGPDPLG